MTDIHKAASHNGAAWDAMMQDFIADEMARDRARWTANRREQADAGVGVSAPLDDPAPWRIRYAVGVVALIWVWGVYEWAVM